MRIDAALCRGHGQCQAVAPEIFSVGEDDRAHLAAPGQDVAAADGQAVEDAIAMCPEAAISWEPSSPSAS